MGIDITTLRPEMRKQILAQLAEKALLPPDIGKLHAEAGMAGAKKESDLEAKFSALWESCNGPELKREVGLIPGRLFRVDFFHPASKTCFELQGFKDHTTRKGFARDNEKFLLLYLLGYIVVTLDRAQITAENIAKIIERVRG